MYKRSNSYATTSSFERFHSRGIGLLTKELKYMYHSYIRKAFNLHKIGSENQFSLVFPPEKPRDIAFIPSVLKGLQRWQFSWKMFIDSWIGLNEPFDLTGQREVTYNA